MTGAVAGVAARRGSARSVTAAADLRAVLPAWLVSRVLVLGVDALVGYLHQQTPAVRSVGLHAWDTNLYASIADHGYGAAATPLLRFWPLTPLLARGLGDLGLSTPAALLLLSNAFALVLPVLLLRLGRLEGWSPRALALLPWLVLLAPPAYVLVTGYAEALGAVLAVGTFLALRSRRWAVAGALGVLAGLDRPLGVLLAVPALVEVARLRAWRTSPGGAVAAVAGPAAGTGAYLLWADVRYGHPLYPYRVQQGAGLRGGVTDPVTNLVHAAKGTLHHQVGTGTHVPWLLLALLLLVPMARRLPPSYTLFAAATLAATSVGSNLFSSERYLWSAFPFLVAVALLLERSEDAARAVLTLSTGLLVAYALLSFVAILPP